MRRNSFIVTLKLITSPPVAILSLLLYCSSFIVWCDDTLKAAWDLIRKRRKAMTSGLDWNDLSVLLNLLNKHVPLRIYCCFLHNIFGDLLMIHPVEMTVKERLVKLHQFSFGFVESLKISVKFQEARNLKNLKTLARISRFLRSSCRKTFHLKILNDSSTRLCEVT